MSTSSGGVAAANTIVTTIIPSLMPVHPQANTVTFHIWSLSPGSLNLDISTSNLQRVAGWREASCVSNVNRFQTARITATANFISGADRFTADVYPLIANNVS